MSSIVTEQGVVHYEVAGRGRPVILLHGWLGSWDYWADTMARLEGSYRCYALDFWGFGDSGKQRQETFFVSNYVALVEQFMDRMGIEAAPVIGHSMGGTVSLSLALAKPDRVKQVAVVGSPINGTSLSFWLKLAGMPVVAHFLWTVPYALSTFLKLYSLKATRQSDVWYKMVMRDSSAATVESFFSSIRSLRYTDLTPQMGNITVPVLGIYGVADIIVNPNQGKLLSQTLSHAQVAIMTGSGHFPMLDEPDLFNQYLIDFLYKNI